MTALITPSASAPQGRIVHRVAGQIDRAVGARDGGARLVGGGVHPVEISVRRPTLLGECGQASLFRLRLNERGLRRIQFRVRFLELQAKVGLVKLRQRIAFAHESASVDKPGGYLAADPEGQIAFDARLDDPGENLRLLARGEMRVRDQDRAGLSGFGRLMRPVAADASNARPIARRDACSFMAQSSPG